MLAMISGLGDPWDRTPRLAAIRADASIRDDLLWRVFDIEGGGEVSLANVDRWSDPGCGWADCFRELVAAGEIPRDRVLAGCLDAVGLGFGAFRARFFTQLYLSLAPTVDEVVAAQPRFLRLLGVPVPATVAFAVKQLALIEKQGVLDDPGFLAACGPALTVTAKNTPLTVLRQIDVIAGRSDLSAAEGGRGVRRSELSAAARGMGELSAGAPAMGHLSAEAAAVGLEHPHRDVQSAALALLRKLSAPEPAAERLHLLEPTVAREASGWLGISSDKSEMSGRAGAGATSVDEWARADAAVVDEWARAAAAVVEDREHAVPVVVDDRTHAERAAALLAGETDPWAIETFLAAFAAGGRDELAILGKQAARAYDGEWQLRHSIAALLLGKPIQVDRTFLVARLAEIQQLTTPYTLLATPTDPAGWIEPLALVERVAGTPLRHDLIAALLRLHPDGRAEALVKASGLAGEEGAAIRYALGGPPAPIGDQALWTAAARSRAPFDDDPHLIASGLDRAGQGRAAHYTLRLEPRDERIWTPYLEVDPTGGRRQVDQPTVLPAGTLDDYHWWTADWIPWEAQTWPHDAEPFLTGHIRDAICAADWHEEAVPKAVEALLTHPGRLGPVAASLLAAALTAQAPATRIQAAETFAELVPHRIPVSTMAAAMTALAAHATATRWASALHDIDARAVLASLLPQLPHNHPGLHALLATFQEDCVRAGAVPLTPQLLAWLRDFGGSSKASRTARALLADPLGRK